MNLSRELLDELYAALEGVSDVLSKVPDDATAWNAVCGIQASINDAQQTVSDLSDKLKSHGA